MSSVGAECPDEQHGAVVAAVVLSACGVSTQDKPQVIEESTPPPPEATPSFDTETGPPTDTQNTTAEPTTTTPVPSGSAPPPLG